MADFDSSLPVRTENNGDVAAKIVDGTIPSQTLTVDASGKITVKLDDAAGNGITSQASGGQRALDVGIDVGGVQIDPRSIRALTASDSVTVIQGTSPWIVSGSISVVSSGSVSVTNLPTTVDTNYGVVGASTIRTAAQIGNSTGAADFNSGATGAQTLRVEANQGAANATPWNINIADVSGSPTSATNPLFVEITLGASGSVSAANPLPVTIDPAAAGTPVHDFKQASSVAAAASDNHDYTVTAGKTLYLQQVASSASGKAKMTVQVETGVATNSFTTFFVQFNSTAETNMEIEFPAPKQVAAGVRVRVIMLNRENQSDDLYSTISGFEV